METPASEAALLNRCRIVENAARNLCDKYSSRVDERLKAELGRLVNRAREYEHGTFIILVVGPAKSGKSTLVNLIAHDFVSPTGFLECTVRPSVISRRVPGEDSSLTVYSGTDRDMRLEQIDSIIDIIRGFGNDSALQGVLCNKMELNEENIRNHVQLGLEKSLDSQNLLSSIRTQGGNLLQDRVFVIDMPGFDGAYQNIDNPVYETIARRADLIIFVQSSNAAFSKVSKEFLKVLSANNHSVPVCLVHNVFDAAWWRDEASKQADIETQRGFACDEIRRMGFNIDREYSFCINLGAVQDYRNGMADVGGKLASAAAKYDVMEQMMYDRIITKRDSMRLNNTLARVGQHRDHISDLVSGEVAALMASLKRYEDEERRLVQLRPDMNTIKVEVPEPDVTMVHQTVVLECEAASRGINLNITKNNSEARKIVEDAVAAVSQSLNDAKARIFGLCSIAENLYLKYRGVLSHLEAELASAKGFVRAEPLECLDFDNIGDFAAAAYISIDNIVPHKLFALFTSFGAGHTGQDLCQYLSVVREQLAPTPDPGRIADSGVIARADVPRIAREIDLATERMASTYRNSLLQYFNKVSQSILSEILADSENTRLNLDTLVALDNDLKRLSV